MQVLGAVCLGDVQHGGAASPRIPQQQRVVVACVQGRAQQQGMVRQHRCWGAAAELQPSKHRVSRAGDCHEGAPSHSPTLASSAELPGHQQTSSTVLPCPASVCSGCRRVPAPGAVLLLPGDAARLVLWASKSHTNTCRREAGHGGSAS